MVLRPSPFDSVISMQAWLRLSPFGGFLWATPIGMTAGDKNSLDSSAFGVRMTRSELQSLRMEAFAVSGGKALAADGVEVGLGAVSGVFIKAVSRIKFF